MDLADRIIAQNQTEERKREYAPHYGIDDTGIPIPKPVNADYVVMRILGNINMYKIGEMFFVDKRRYRETAQNIIALCGRPRLVMFEGIDEEDKLKQHEANEEMWRQMKSVINSEHGLIWEKLRDMVPDYSKRYLRINKQLVWDRENADIIVLPEDYLG